MPRTNTTTGERTSFAMVQPKPASTPQGAALRPVSEFKLSANQRAKDWQVDAYAFTWAIGEVGYVHNLTANTVAACDLRVTEVTGGTVVDSEDPRAIRVLDAFVGPRGGRKELLRRAALNYRIAGEVYLVGTPSIDVDSVAPGDSPALLWEFLSCREVTTDASGEIRRTSTGQGQGQGRNEMLDKESSYITRWWQSDPEFSALPDCAMRRAIPICRELVSLTQVIDATAKSSLAANILAVPEGMSFAGQQDDVLDGDPDADDEDVDPFTEILWEHMATPVEDRSSASSLVPLVLRGDPTDIAAVRIIEVGKDIGAWAVPLREEALKRLADALDTPPEIMSGKANLNHWTGYSVDADFSSKHVVPLGESLAEFLTVSYLRPMLVVWEGMTEAEAARFTIEFDPSNILARADAGTTAIALWRERIVSRKAVARANNVDEADLMTDDELVVETLRDMVKSNPMLLGTYGKYIPGFKELPGAAPSSAEPVRESLPPTTPLPRDPESGGGEPPLPGTQSVSRRLAELAHVELLDAVRRTPLQNIDDGYWLMLTAEAAGEVSDWLAQNGLGVVESDVLRAMALFARLMTMHAASTGGRGVYENGLSVPDWLTAPVLEVACGNALG